MNSTPPPPPVGIVTFLPMLLLCALLAVLMFRIARRKGRSELFCLLGFVPFANVMVALWLASLTDKAVLDQLAELKRRLG